MSAEDDDRAIDRFVAGAPVDADELARAITAKAADRAIVVEAVLKNLASNEPVVRRRAAERVARMPDAAPPLAARLKEMAVNETHPATRDACIAALRAHGQDVPGEEQPERAAAREPWTARILIAAFVTRSEATEHHARIEARYGEDAPALRGRLYPDPAGARLELEGLPAEFAGTTPVVRGQRSSGAPGEAIAAADAPVTADGTVTMTIRLEGAGIDDVAAWLRYSDLIVPRT